MNSGIYKITCLSNGRFYVGSTFDLKIRWQEHRSRLRKNKHENPHLQNAWNKYGESNFKYEIIEKVPDDKLFDVEQSYLDKLNAYDSSIGFNQSKNSRGVETDKMVKEYIVTLPNGEEVYVKNLLKFCRLHNLGTNGGLHQVARGLTNQCDGYRARYANQSVEQWKSTLKRSEKSGSGWKGNYRITLPTGEVVIISSLNKFCKEHNLSQGNMASVCRGERNQHKGYKCEFVTCTQANI